MVMKKMILIIALFTFPFLSISQNDLDKQEVTSRDVIESVIEFELDNSQIVLEWNNDSLAYRKVEPISQDPKDQNKSINFTKSNELISIKAYIKSLQMKRKITLMS